MDRVGLEFLASPQFDLQIHRQCCNGLCALVMFFNLHVMGARNCWLTIHIFHRSNSQVRRSQEENKSPATVGMADLNWKLYTSNGPITTAIRARFEYDSSAIRARYNILRGCYVLSSNNEHVNSFALL